MKRKVVIGLEIHLQLKTKTKLFCGCSTDYIGATPNTNVCPICLAVPGTLPVINDHAVDLAVKMGLGLHCEIQDGTRFHRKHYFYADLPKAYQITQYEHAIAQGGYLDVIADGKPKRIRLDHLHLEEDAGKLVHPTADGRLSGAAYSLVDYNRGGMPLSEIVSMPDMNSPAEAIAYVTQIRQLARYLDVSDGEMESGSLRVDVNVSLCNPDGSFGTRVELKNINSLKSIERALEYEIARQNRVLDEGGTLVQETRLWDDAAGVTRSMRSKEGARDYRYYVEMDLAPIDAKPRLRGAHPRVAARDAVGQARPLHGAVRPLARGEPANHRAARNGRLLRRNGEGRSARGEGGELGAHGGAAHTPRRAARHHAVPDSREGAWHAHSEGGEARPLQHAGERRACRDVR